MRGTNGFFKNSTHKRICIAGVILIIMLYAVVSAVLFWEIQTIQSPEPTITIDLIEINTEELLIGTTLMIKNPNQFNVLVKNLEVNAKTPNGKEVTHIVIEGGEIPSNRNRTFTSSDVLHFDGELPDSIQSTISGIIGINMFGVLQKTIPLNFTVITLIGDAIKGVSLPVIHIQGEFGELTQKGVNLTADIDIYNPNSFALSIDNLSVEMKTDTGEHVGNVEVTGGGVIKAKQSLLLNGTGTVYITALNAKTLTIVLIGSAGARIAGINKSLPLSLEVQLKLPDLGTLLSSTVPTDVVLSGDYKISLKGIVDDITLEINNPNKITLLAKNIMVSLYRIDRGKKQLICEGLLGDSIVEAEKNTTIHGQLLIPFSKLITPLGGRILPDWIQVTVRSNITIQGLNRSIYVGIIGYQDFRPFQ